MLRFKFLIIALALTLPKVALAQDNLSEVSKLKAENFQLKVQVAQLTATVQDRENRLKSIELTAEQTKLVEEFRAELKAGKDDEFNWETLKFEKPKEPLPSRSISPSSTISK